VSHSLGELLDRLDALAAYDGAWTPLREEAPLLRERLDELRRRESRLDDLLIIALVGGSGVGKSTLLNALAGDTLAATSEFRPCTSVPTVYHPPGAQLDFADWNCVSGSALEHLVVVDTPDSDTIVKEHRATTEQALAQCDLILICGSSEKYLDEATWSLLRPLRGERTMVCIETKAHEDSESIREHWQARMEEEGFKIDAHFRLSARRTLDRKLGGSNAGSEFDLPQLESYLRDELSRERVQRIKRSNAVGLLTKTLETLYERVGSRSEDLKELKRVVEDADLNAVDSAVGVVRRRLFAEPHLWTYAIGHEVSLRGKGLVGTLYRAVEALRSFPARMAGWLPWVVRGGAGQQAAALLTDRDLFADDVAGVSDVLEAEYREGRSKLGVALAQAGFTQSDLPDGFEAFEEDVRTRLSEVLRGPARDRLVARAKSLTCWPVTVLADLPAVAFMGFAGYNIVQIYFAGDALPTNYFLHTAIVLGIVIGIELVVMSLLARGLAWSARAAATRDLRHAFLNHPMAFAPEQTAVDEAIALAETVNTVYTELDRDE
jgi:hypothetical protein